MAGTSQSPAPDVSGPASAAPPTPSAAQSVTGPLDVMILQTAASLENLLVSAYTTAAGLPLIMSGNRTIQQFITRTGAQHAAHARAFNAQVAKVGGAAQTAADPRYASSVANNLTVQTDAMSATSLLITLEDVAAQTYTRYISLSPNAAVRKLFGTAAPVEAQHLAMLLVMQSLLKGDAQELIALPTQSPQLPAKIGSVGLPDTFYPIADASAIDEGSVP
jgi:Ferritin-like domain